MKIKKGYILLMLIGLLYSCSQESLPEPKNGTPVFTASGTLGNNPINIKAGDDDYYMFTEFLKDDSDVFTFSGTFAKLEPDCEPTCNEKLRISIRDFQMTEGDLVTNIDSSLFVGKYEYEGSSEDSTEITSITSYDVNFINKTISSFGEEVYVWHFFPNEVNSYEIETFGIEDLPETQNFPTLDFPVTLERLDFEPIITCKDFTQTLDTLNMNCSSGLKLVLDSGSLDFFSVSVQDTFDLESSVWVDSIGIISMENELSINEAGEYCVQATYLNGCENETCIRSNFNDLEEFNYCSVAFDYWVTPKFETTTIFPDNPFCFSKTIVEYVNENGISYRSDRAPQSDESQFEILEVSDFEDNENGEKTKQLKIRFNCVLYSENDLSLNVENAEVVIAVAYPGG